MHKCECKEIAQVFWIHINYNINIIYKYPFERKSELNLFHDNLKKHLRVTFIEYLSSDCSTQKLKEREAYWQSQLSTYANYGGFNKREPRTETSSQS